MKNIRAFDEINQGPILKSLNETETLISENLEYHIKNAIPLCETEFRMGSFAHLALALEMRELYEADKLDLCFIDQRILLETDLGYYGMFEGHKVALDCPYDINDTELLEAEYKGKEVSLNKPKRNSGPGKKYVVYTKNSKGNVIKVNFGDMKGGLTSKINDPEARAAFAKRHNCESKNDKTSPGYWSCRLPRYAKLLGLKAVSAKWW